jgi:3-oxoacyl-[acyl-carrier-protein] synthase-3
MRAKIIGLGACVPPKVLTNNDLAKFIDTSDEWITSRTGIKERRVADEGTATSDLAVIAAERALSSAQIKAGDLELILVATCSPDTLFPNVGCIVQEKLGITMVPAFDLSAACSGFNFALSTAQAYIESEKYRTILVIGADTLAKYLDWKDRTTSILFGDGAGAAVLSATEKEEGILSSYIFAKGEGGKFLVMPGGGSRDPENLNGRFIRMDGKEVFKFAVKALENSVIEVVKSAGYDLKDIDLLIPHQANIRII